MSTSGILMAIHLLRPHKVRMRYSTRGGFVTIAADKRGALVTGENFVRTRGDAKINPERYLDMIAAAGMNPSTP